VPANVGRAQEITRADAVSGRSAPVAGASVPPPRRGPGTSTEPAGSTTTTGRTPPPADRREIQELEPVPRSPDGGLIDRVGDRPVTDYLHDLATSRAQDMRDMRDTGDVTRGSVGEVHGVGIDRRTGEVVEAVNGRGDDVIPDERVHPVLRERLEQMRQAGPYPQYNNDGTPRLGSDGQQVMSPYPHSDEPLRHAEVKIINELLWRRGEDADASVMSEFEVDTNFPFVRDGIRPAPCCANCSSLLAGTPNNAGQVTHGAGHPDQQFIPRWS
jgi:hypothetical protein